mmetsp:Transcript_14602/g.27716  ORF Transcript_14602/g.27716 Transcript_14602/m.27716 type:complete len:246 (+) Transcript_14602:188-925(+)|eukprot:scaffold2501_cov174-Amphora_coffeaeformis.AAC.12
MKTSSGESNVPIQAEDNIPERLELTGLRNVIDDEYELRGVEQHERQDETDSMGRKGSKIKGLGLSKGFPALVKSIPAKAKICLGDSPETHDPGSAKNSDNNPQYTLKRKKDDESYYETIQESYGYGDNDGVDAGEPSTSVCGHVSEDDRSMMPPPKRFRYMRRNSFVIHRRKGQFTSVGFAIDAVSLECETRQMNITPTDSCTNNAILPTIQTPNLLPHRLSESRDGYTYSTASGDEKHKESFRS